jgi:hypothetical protein
MEGVESLPLPPFKCLNFQCFRWFLVIAAHWAGLGRFAALLPAPPLPNRAADVTASAAILEIQGAVRDSEHFGNFGALSAASTLRLRSA